MTTVIMPHSAFCRDAFKRIMLPTLDIKKSRAIGSRPVSVNHWQFPKFLFGFKLRSVACYQGKILCQPRSFWNACSNISCFHFDSHKILSGFQTNALNIVANVIDRSEKSCVVLLPSNYAQMQRILNVFPGGSRHAKVTVMARPTVATAARNFLTCMGWSAKAISSRNWIGTPSGSSDGATATRPQP